jgi:hypothetical protein
MFWINKKFVFFFTRLNWEKFVDKIVEANWWKHLMNSLLDGGLQFRKLRGKISMAREGALQIFETVKTMMEDKAQSIVVS